VNSIRPILLHDAVHARAQVEQQMDLSKESVVIVDRGDVNEARFTFIA
jgi:hypothetical protein